MSASMLPASTKRPHEIAEAQKTDAVIQVVHDYCLDRWPKYQKHNLILQPYWEKNEHFTILDDLLLFDDRILIPQQMQMEVLNAILVGYLGITKCRARTRNAVYWPRMSERIEEIVNKCPTCAKVRTEPKEPLMKSAFPQKPWEKIGMDLCCRGNDTFLVVVDYYSRWLECKKLINLSSAYMCYQKVKNIILYTWCSWNHNVG